LKFLESDYYVVGIDNLNDYYDVGLKKDRLKYLGLHFHNDSLTFTSSNPNFEFIHSSIESISTWNHICLDKKFDFVINLAAQAGVRKSLIDPHPYIYSNIVGFQNVIDFCVKESIPLLYASSSSVYGKSEQQPFEEDFDCNEPESLYAATKRANELFAYSYSKTKKLKAIGLRFFTVYGPWGRPDMAPMLFANAATSDRKICVFNNGNQFRDFTHISDIVNGIFLIAQQFNSIVEEAVILNIGRGEPVGLMDFIRNLENEFDIKYEIDYLPEQSGDVPLTFASTKLLSKLTGFSPKIDLKTGVKEFVDWYKNYYNSNI
jgi:UDP-glucuronate 4-epimerase